MSDSAPLWICFVPQLASVVGDSFGQRCSRVYHGGNRRRFIISLITVSSIQMFVVLTIIQLALPDTTKIIYEKVNGTSVDFCEMPEHVDDDRCYAQGPLTIYRAVGLCPLLLLNGLLNLVYYIGEASMYRQSLGVLMLVLAALASSFIIAPLQMWFDLDGAKQVNGGAIALGIVGALLCLIERTPPAAAYLHVPGKDDDLDADNNIGGGGSTMVVSQDSFEINSIQIKSASRIGESSRLTPPPLAEANTIPSGATSAQSSRVSRQNNNTAIHRLLATLRKVRSFLPMLLPFVLLSFAYALYFVIMLLYNDKCKINMWGYNSYDQVTFPLYMFAVFFVVDFFTPCHDNIRWDEQQEESLWVSMKLTFRELTANKCAGLGNMFFYRLLINARAIAYSYITVQYNLSSSYLQLTLIRVVLSWMASLVLVLLLPKFILSEPMEQLKLRDWVNLSLKFLGTGAIVGSLLIIHYE